MNPPLTAFNKTHILTRPGCTGNHGNKSGRVPAFGSLNQCSASLAATQGSMIAHCPDQILGTVTHNCFSISFGGCFMFTVRCWTQGSWGSAPSLFESSVSGCADDFETVSVISCSVICTIRTAFLPEAFDEQLQKQIAATVAELTAAEREEKKKKKEETDRSAKQDRCPSSTLPGPHTHPFAEMFSCQASKGQPY